MQKSTQRRVLAVLTVVFASQLLAACVVLPVPAHRHRTVVIEPGYGGHSHGHDNYRDSDRRR